MAIKKYIINIQEDDLHKLEHLATHNKIVHVSGVNMHGKEFNTKGIVVLKPSKQFFGQVADQSGIQLFVGEHLIDVSFGFDYEKDSLVALKLLEPDTKFEWHNPYAESIKTLTQKIGAYKQENASLLVDDFASRNYNHKENLQVLQNSIGKVIEVGLEDKAPKQGVLLDYLDLPDHYITQINVLYQGQKQPTTENLKDNAVVHATNMFAEQDQGLGK